MAWIISMSLPREFRCLKEVPILSHFSLFLGAHFTTNLQNLFASWSTVDSVLKKSILDINAFPWIPQIWIRIVNIIYTGATGGVGDLAKCGMFLVTFCTFGLILKKYASVIHFSSEYKGMSDSMHVYNLQFWQAAVLRNETRSRQINTTFRSDLVQLCLTDNRSFLFPCGSLSLLPSQAQPCCGWMNCATEGNSSVLPNIDCKSVILWRLWNNH
jgi:hypothetical protein